MEDDPGVLEGIFHARLFPYQALLMGNLQP